jgi:anti-sigma regulatory factor (Ser/Thr protein kinase)
MVPPSAPHDGGTASAGPGHRARFARDFGAGADCDVRLTLPARASNVAVVRHVVGALAEAVHMPPALVEDVKLAVTEACTNVVRHAYAGREGPLYVAVAPGEASLTILVADHGRGIRPGNGSGGAGLGLPLIAALADHVEIDNAQDQGSRVRMRFGSAGTLDAA